MADQPEKKKRPAKRRPAKKTSKIAEAQQAAVKRRQERDTLRAQSASEAARRAGAKITADKPTAPQSGTPKVYPGDPNYPKAPDRTKTSGPGDSKPIKDPLLAGLSMATGVNDPATEQAVASRMRPLANPDLYGTASASRLQRLQDIRAAADQQKLRALSKNDNAVYMGPGKIRYRRSGPRRMDEYGSDVETIVGGDDIQTKDELMSWLSDPAKVEAIKARALKAGLAVESYEDIAKLWQSVVAQAATTYSRTQKKVTPWALIEMRGKYVGPDGKMKDKVTVSTQIDEMDPAQARGLLEQTASQMLGRAPSQSELDDFIAKAQMIARNNPSVTTTTSRVGFDGEVETGTSQSVTKGGGAAVNAQAQTAAIDMAKQDEDYGAYQAAGTYFPLLFDALSSPV